MRRAGYLGAVLILLSSGWFMFTNLSSGWFMFTNTTQAKQDSEIYRAASSVFANALLIQNPEIENAYLYLVFPSGEAANPFNEGLAHYVEHLAWLSAFSDSREDNRHSNAWTNHFSTGYWQKTVVGDLQGALQTLVSVAMPLSVEAEFALEERNILLREYDYRVTERPLYPVLLDMDRAIYGNGSLARTVIGTRFVIAGYSLEDAATLHERSHILSEATLMLYGNVSRVGFEAALESLSVASEQMPAREAPPNAWVENGSVVDKASLSLPNLGDDTLLYRKLVPLASCDGPAHCAMVIQIAEKALDSALPGGLAGPLRFDRFVARSFSFDIALIGNEYAEVIFKAHPDADVSLGELDLAFQDAFRTTLGHGLTEDTFERVSSRIEGDLTSVLDRNRPRYNRDLALGQLMEVQPVISLENQINVVESVHLEDVNQFLKSLLADGREVTRLVAAER